LTSRNRWFTETSLLELAIRAMLRVPSEEHTMARPQDNDDKVDELTSGLDELKTTVEELQIDTATDIGAGRLEAVKSALEEASEAADEIEEERDSDDPAKECRPSKRSASRSEAKPG
jgi:hypothetical protein